MSTLSLERHPQRHLEKHGATPTLTAADRPGRQFAAGGSTGRGAGRTAMDTVTLDAWADKIATDGIAAHEEQARRVVTVASSLGLCPVLVDVLADRSEPAVARERAFGRLALALSRTPAA